MIDRRIQELVRRLENQELMGRPSRSDAQVARGLRSITERLYKREAETRKPENHAQACPRGHPLSPTSENGMDRPCSRPEPLRE